MLLPTDHTDHGERSSTAQQVGTAARLNESPADAMAALIQATLAPIVAPLVAEQAALRQVVERQAEQLVGKEQEIGTIRKERGRLTAELERARAERDAADRSRRRDVRRLSIALTALAALTIAATLAPAWVR